MSDAVEKPSILVFVYGTLQRGENNYAWWMAHPQHAVFICEGQTAKRYPLFVNLLPGYRGCSPCLLNKPEEHMVGDSKSSNSGGNDNVIASVTVASHRVVGELFMITESMRKWLDVLEDIEDGTYTTGTIDVIPLDNAQVVSKWLCVDEGDSVPALVYFRDKRYPKDWDSPNPSTSTRLLERFSAEECLRLYGSRFAGFPAHMRCTASLQEELNKAGCLCDGTCGVPIRPKPIVMFIIDGVGDVTYPELGYRTPLEVVAGVPSRSAQDEEVAETRHSFDTYVSPGINVITRNGVSGLMDVFKAGVTCGSDTAHLAIFGYHPMQYYKGRGAYEALGAGLALDDDDLAFKSNFSVLDEDTGIVMHRRCDREFTKEGAILCEYLNGTVISGDDEGIFDAVHTLKLQYATEHRCGVAITGKGLSECITGTDPLTDCQPLVHCKPTVPPDHEEYPAALYTSRVVNAASKRISELLRIHPINLARESDGKRVANVVLLRGAAKKGWVPPFVIRHGLIGSIVSPTCIIKGLGICCGLKAIEAKGATGDYSTDVNSKVDAALLELGLGLDYPTATSLDSKTGDSVRSNLAVIHVKGVDDAGHDRSLEKKLMMLQRCGDAMQRMWDALPDGSTMVVLADHSTPVSLGDHSCEPVPVSVATKGTAFHDGVTHYSEVESSHGALGRFHGDKLLGIVKRSHYWYHYKHHEIPSANLDAAR